MSEITKKAWARISAFAWDHPKVLEDLRKDPKETIEQIAKGDTGKYKADQTTAEKAQIIKDLANTSEGYSGYLPIPYAFGGLENLEPTQLKELLEKGVTGALRFDEKAELWANLLSQAWNDEDLLKDIRQDPLNRLPQDIVDELKNSKYGIFPIPDRPNGLDELTIEQLEDFLSDEANLPHLTGIINTAP